MSRRALILAVVVLLIASSVAVLGSSAARGASAPAPSVPTGQVSHPSVSSIQLRTGYGECPSCNETTYTTGPWYEGNAYYGYNILYFQVYDPAGDSKVTFTVTDFNATRDHVGNPAFSATVPINNTTDLYQSFAAGVSFTFPSSLTIGGGWNVSVSGALGGNASYPIYVETYFLSIDGSPSPGAFLLPGESVTTNYQALSDVNGAPDTAITNVSFYGYYYGANDTFVNLWPGNGIVTQPIAALGGYTWTVPANATFDTYIYIYVWVSIYVGGHQAENESYDVDYGVGTLAIEGVSMEANSGSLCPGGTQYYYPTGSLIQVCAVVGAFGGEDQFWGVPNLPVTVSFWNGATHVTPPGNTPTSFTTNATGYVTFSFWANIPQFSTWYQPSFYNSVNLTATDPAAKPSPPNTDYVAYANTTFAMEASDQSAGVSVALNQLSYYPGQAITATWSTDPTNTTVGTVTAEFWVLENPSGDVLGQGTIGSTANTGMVTVKLPTGYLGTFWLYVYAANATAEFQGDTAGVVVAPYLILNPSSTTFSPGSTVTLQAQAWGDASLASPVIDYQVYASYGLGGHTYGGYGLVSSGTVGNGSSFSIAVPSTGAPDEYQIYAYLTGGTGTVASAELNLYQSWGYNVFIGVTTLSNYADGSYQPGQSLTVSYQIAPYGNAPLPVFYTFEVFLGGTQISSLISTPDTSGTVQVTIPSGWQTGFAILEVELEGTYLSGNSCGGGFCYGETGITINAHPSFLSENIGAGSGLTVGWLILLIIIIVVLVVLVLMIRRKGRGAPPSGGAPVTEPMNPPAPAPSGPGAAAWQEPPPASPPPASDEQPPMPSPPPGAT
jgi:hypothetical protein